MPKPRRSRSRSRSRSRNRSHRRHRSRFRSPSGSRAKSRGRRYTRSRSPRRNRSSSSRSRTPPRYRLRTKTPIPHASRESTLDTILLRLNAIENNFATTRTVNSEASASSAVQAIADALQSVNPIRVQNYFVSNFDPATHNIETWCEEVDRAQLANRWTDIECLARVAGCLKGDAKTWLNEWVTNDRTWPNFKREFKPLCPRKLDYANILFEVMNKTSDKYPTFAEYARRSILRLRIVRGLSDELLTQIVIRGINDAQVRAAAANAELNPETLVSFLAIYTKPSQTPQVKATKVPTNQSQSRYHKAVGRPNPLGPRCYICKQHNHKSFECPNKTKTPNPNVTCAFCKKVGHSEEKCFAKERSAPRNTRNVNLCSDLTDSNSKRDVTTAVVQGIPVDVLIDSGAHDVSLISSDVVKHFSCAIKHANCTLKGLSNQEIKANSYVTLTIELSDISFEADLVIVPAGYMSTPIIIGTDVLNRDGITYIRTKDKQFLTHSKDKRAVVLDVTTRTIDVNTPLQGSERDSLVAVINEFSEYFISGTATTTVTTGQMHINVTSDVPVTYRPYKLSHTEKLKVRNIVDDLLDKGIIRESVSEYSSPIILVKKKDGSDRMCVDYRALNRITVKDRYPLPLIDDHVDRLGDRKITRFSSLDMATGFHQIKISDDSVHRTAFITPEGHYEYLKMPYGLTNSPIVYQRIINKTLRKFIDAGQVLVYIDDVLLMSPTVHEGIELLREVLTTLTEAGFSINLRKCTFLTTEVEYLGRIISQGQVRPSPHKITALVNSPAPRSVKQVRQFLGLAGYFRKYIKGYATKTLCISQLLKNGVTFSWGPEQEKVRQEIISILTNEPVLAIFDPNLPTEVHTDASSIGYGAVLLQTHDVGKRVVAYYSKVTQGAEGRYHSYELETLAVVRALQNFRHYLIGIQFKVVTDCNALKSTERKKDLLPRVARWWIYLQDFTFDIEYRKGAMMSHADYLSRNPPLEVNNISRPRNWAEIAQTADEETQNLLQQLSEGNLDSSRYQQQNGLLYYKYSPVGETPRLLCFIPKGHRLSLLRVFHDEHSHVGFDKTISLILKHFWFPGLRHFVKKYIQHCLVCMSKKRVPRAPHQIITSWEKPEVPFSVVHMDALGPLPESNNLKFVLLVIDAFTKYTLLYPICRQDVEELLKVVTNAISLFGVPKLFVTDKGRMFESSRFLEFVKEIGSDIHHITPEMHQANGQVERYCRTVLNMLRIETNHKGASWSECLWKLQLTLNITKQKTTQASPLKLMIGTDATTPVIRALIRDIALEGSQPNREAQRELRRGRATELLRRNQSQQDDYVNRTRRPPRTFNINDLVFVIKFSQCTGKLDSGMRGPYRVVRALPSGRYELRLLSGSYGKTTQAAAQYMVLWKGEWCPDTCAAFFERELMCEIHPLREYVNPSKLNHRLSDVHVEDVLRYALFGGWTVSFPSYMNA